MSNINMGSTTLEASTCRLCAQQDDEVVQILEGEGKKLDLEFKIKKCFAIVLTCEDHLPKGVCPSCCKRLEDFYDFFEMTLEAQVKLKVIFSASTTSNSNQQHEKERHETQDEPLDLLKLTDDIGLNGRIHCDMESKDDDASPYNSKDLHTLPCAYDTVLREILLSPLKINSYQKEMSASPSKNTNEINPTNKCKEMNISLLILNSSPETTNYSKDSTAEERMIVSPVKTNSRGFLNTSLMQINSACDNREIPPPHNSAEPTLSLLNSTAEECTAVSPLKLHSTQWTPFEIVNYCNNRTSRLDLCTARKNLQALVDSVTECDEGISTEVCDFLETELTEDSSRSHGMLDDVFSTVIKDVEPVPQKTPLRLKINKKKNIIPPIRVDKRNTRSSLNHTNVETDDNVVSINNQRRFIPIKCANVSSSQVGILPGNKTINMPGDNVLACPTVAGSRIVLTSWPCAKCGAVLESRRQLKQHFVQEHDEPPLFYCQVCSKVYDKYYSFLGHVRTHQNAGRYTCDVCGKQFCENKVLEAHKVMHSDARPYVCEECGKTFKRSSSLYVHKKYHQPAHLKYKFPCDICGKCFVTRPNLTTHLKTHTGERNFTCDTCGKSFIQKGNLEAHIRCHTEEKPHHCETCGKSFKTTRHLLKHKKVHTDEKPHQCDVCGRTFRERNTMREHKRIHTGALPFACEYCGRCFRFKGVLVVHRRSHTGEKPYSCSVCDRKFTNWPNYNKHFKRRHKQTTTSGQRSSSAVVPILMKKIPVTSTLSKSSEHLTKPIPAQSQLSFCTSQATFFGSTDTPNIPPGTLIFTHPITIIEHSPIVIAGTAVGSDFKCASTMLNQKHQ